VVSLLFNLDANHIHPGKLVREQTDASIGLIANAEKIEQNLRSFLFGALGRSAQTSGHFVA
jgi:hypothetical protein